MNYIVINKRNEKYEKFDSLEDARLAIVEVIDDGDVSEDFTLLKVAEEYKVVSAKKILFKKV